MDFNNPERKTKAELFELIQSKQEEVNKLQKDVDALKMSNHYLAVQVLDAEAYSDCWEKKFKRLQLENDALKAKIDLALTKISNHYHSCVARKNLKQMSALISEISEIEVHELNMQTLERILKGE